MREFDDVPFDVTEEDPDYCEEVLDRIYKEGSETGDHKNINAVSANYYLARIKKNKEKAAQYAEQAKQMKDDFKVRVDNWLASRQHALDYDTQYCMDVLELYYEENKPANGKSISLPEGNIGMYTVQAKYDFDTGKEDILKFLEQYPGLHRFIRNKPEINKSDLKKACTVEDGKLYIDGYEIPKAGFTPKTTEFGVR